jgi:protein O-GlcNAc transferase
MNITRLWLVLAGTFVAINIIVSFLQILDLQYGVTPPPQTTIHLSTVDDEELHLNTQNGVPNTIVKAHIAGYTVLDNVYMKNGTFYVVGVNDLKKNFVSADTEIQYVDSYDVESIFNTRYIPRVHGTTLLFSEKRPMLLHAHFYHFYEFLLGAIAFLGINDLPVQVTTALFPAQDSTKTQKYGWRDAPGLNELLLTSSFPNVATVTKETWDALYKESPFGRVFDRLVVIDRLASYSEHTNGYWGKMLLEIKDLVQGKPHPWFPVRENMFRTLGITHKPRDPQRKVITYMSRQHNPNRKFSEETHEQLVEKLKSFEPTHEVNIIVMHLVSLKEQVELISRTDVLISIHSNGLTHMIFQKPGSAVIEIFPGKNFARDYELTASMMGIHYYAIQDGTRVCRGPELIEEGNFNEELNQPPYYVTVDIPTIDVLLTTILEEQ